MKQVTLIIHGWSDCSKSFEGIKNFLVDQGLGTVETILYADYESREDHMTMEDIADGLNSQLIKKGLLTAEGKKLARLNVIVHSTGGLVIRQWISTYYGQTGRMADCPVEKIVMLAPANFGSPLAHRGKSFFSSLIKGRWQVGDFLETGRQILSALELGSPFQWALAHEDVIQKKPYFSADKIQTTILVGIEGFGGVASVVNKPGTDGTVVIAGTSLDSAKLTLDFTKPQKQDPESCPYEWAIENPKGDFAFGVLEGLDHSRIVHAAADENSQAASLLLEALKIKSVGDFRAFQDKTQSITLKTYEATGQPRFQQFLVHAQDDLGRDVEDFTLDFYIWKAKDALPGKVVKKENLSKEELEYTQKAGNILSANFHTHTVNPSYRSFLVDLGALSVLLEEAKNSLKSEMALSMRMLAAPVDPGIHYAADAAQNIVLHQTGEKKTGLPSFFYDNTTTLLELRVDRENTYVTVSETAKKH